MLAHAIVAKYNITLLDAKFIVKAVTETIMEELMINGSVSVGYLGVCRIIQRKDRIGVNPHTKTPLAIPGRKSISMRPSARFKRMLKELK